VFGVPSLYSSKFSTGFLSMRDSHRLFGHEKSVGLISNSQAAIGSLDRTLSRAVTMYREGAFLHHYRKFGVEHSKFEETFALCESVLADYKAI